jgi:hypothetical protein
MDAYGLALDQARKELDEAQPKLKALMLRVSQLESFVAQAEALTGGNKSPTSASLFEEAMPTVPALLIAASADQATAPPPLWKAIINALDGKKGDFTVPEALGALARTGRLIESQNRMNIIRNTIIQRKREFGRLKTGHYFVRGFERTDISANEKEATEATS